MSQPDDRRPAWGAPLAVLAVVAGIVVVWFVGPRLPHRDDTFAAPTTSTTTSTTTRVPTTVPVSTVEIAPGWEHFGTLPFEHSGAVVVDTGAEVIVLNGGRNFSTLPPTSCGEKCQWIGVAIDHETGAMRDLPASPMCNAGVPAGLWAGDELIVWSSTFIDQACPSAAAYSPATNQWWVLDSGIFRGLKESQVVWTGRELVSFTGFAYNPVTGETRDVVAANESPMFTGGPSGLQPLMHWTGSLVLLLGSEGVAVIDSEFAGIADGPVPPIPPWGRTSVWTGQKLLAVASDGEAAVFDPAGERWDIVDSVPFLPSFAGESNWTTGMGLTFLEWFSGVGVWDGSGEWRVLPSPEVPGGVSAALAAAGEYLYDVGRQVYRYRIPDLVDGTLPQPSFLPVGQQYLEVPADWHVTHLYGSSSDSVNRQTVTVELERRDGVACRVESTSSDLGTYVPAFTQAAGLVRDRDGVEIPVGETSSARDGLAHVVFQNPESREIVDVVCPDLGTARLLAAHVWSPHTPPNHLPPGVEGDLTCYVDTEIGAMPGDESTEVVVQLELLNPEPCEVHGPIGLHWDVNDFTSALPGYPPVVVFSVTLTPDEPYLTVTYTLSNWCFDPVAAIITVGSEFEALLQEVTAPCLDADQPSSTFELNGWEGPLAIPKLQP